MRILLTSYYYKPHFGGIENSIYHLAQEYTNAGHEVLIICSDVSIDRKRRLGSEEVIDGIRIMRFKSFIPFFSIFRLISPCLDILACKMLIKKSAFKPDIVITRNQLTGIASLKAGFSSVIYLVPGVVRYQETQFNKISSKDSMIVVLKKWYQKILIIPFIDKLQIILLKKAEAIFVFSNNIYRQILTVAPSIKSRLYITKPGVALLRFSIVNKIDKKNARAKIGVENNVFIFLILCRLTKHKSIEVAIRALNLLHPPKEILLLIVGDGPEKDNLKELVSFSNIEKRVRFFDMTLTPDLFYSAADAFLLPSVHETFGQTILEALFSGLPVIAFDSNEDGIMTASSEIIQHQKTGILCKFNVEDFAMAMENIIRYPLPIKDHLAELEKLYSWKKLSEDLVSLISSEK